MSSVNVRLPAATLAVVLPGLAVVCVFAAAATPAPARAQAALQTPAEAGVIDGRTIRAWARGRRGRKAEPPPEESADKHASLPPGMQQATPVVTFGDWNVFTNGQGKARVCYAIAQPQTRSPKTLARDTGYLFVTVRKDGNIQNEIAVMFGFKPKPAAAQAKPGAAAAKTDPYLSLGSTRYGLVVKDENAWIQNQAEEARIVTEMGKSQTATVRTTSQRGNPTTDEYALSGFADALKRAKDECK